MDTNVKIQAGFVMMLSRAIVAVALCAALFTQVLAEAQDAPNWIGEVRREARRYAPLRPLVAIARREAGGRIRFPDPEEVELRDFGLARFAPAGRLTLNFKINKTQRTSGDLENFIFDFSTKALKIPILLFLDEQNGTMVLRNRANRADARLELTTVRAFLRQFLGTDGTVLRAQDGWLLVAGDSRQLTAGSQATVSPKGGKSPTAIAEVTQSSQGFAMMKVIVPRAEKARVDSGNGIHFPSETAGGE